eukprot:Awhi_evm1s3552
MKVFYLIGTLAMTASAVPFARSSDQTCADYFDKEGSEICKDNGYKKSQSSITCDDSCTVSQCCYDKAEKYKTCQNLYDGEGSSVCNLAGYQNRDGGDNDIDCSKDYSDDNSCYTKACCSNKQDKGYQTCEQFYDLKGRDVCTDNGYTSRRGDNGYTSRRGGDYPCTNDNYNGSVEDQTCTVEQCCRD